MNLETSTVEPIDVDGRPATSGAEPVHARACVLARVLLVEDDVLLTEALSTRLVHSGFEVVSAHDGLQALAILRRASIDAIVLDLGLPGMSGLKFLHEMRMDPECGDPPVVVLTGSDHVQVSRVKRRGVEHVLRKPVSSWRVCAALRDVLDRE